MGVIASVRCLILVVAGGADGVVPAEQSRPHDVAPTPKRYVEIPDADHDDLALHAGDTLIRGVLAVLPRRDPAG